MGSNNSKTLKYNFEQNHFQERGSLVDPNLNQTRQISINHGNEQPYLCFLRELDTSKYTQTLSKVDDFLQKMNNTSPFISSFFFITEARNKPNVFNLIFEGGKVHLDYSDLSCFVSILHSVISALEFLESIHLFHPRIDLQNVIRVQEKTYKLINQFCFNDFLGFITDTYLSNNLSPGELNKILLHKRKQNLLELRAMVSQMIIHHPQINQTWHSLSNLSVFESFLNEAINRNASFNQINIKFKELFDKNQNTNKGYTHQSPVTYSSSKKTYPVVNKSPSQFTKGISTLIFNILFILYILDIVVLLTIK